MNNLIKLGFVLISIFFFTSCVSKKNIVYFNTDTIDLEKVSNSYQTIYKPDDLLQITISSVDIKSALRFNLPVVTFAAFTDDALGVPKQQDFLIDSKGYIEYPVLGRLKLGGLTRNQAEELFMSKLVPAYLQERPIINIRIRNFKVTVEGDVRNPGVFTIPYERITILDALGMAGDLNISGQRNNVLVVREEKGKKITYRVDLRSMKTFTSPVYYLQQNDLVYVEPNNAKSQSSTFNPNYTVATSVASVLISLMFILLRR